MNNKSVKKVLFKHEQKMPREQAATLLETIASKLREDGSFTLNLGEKSQHVEPAEVVEFEIELEERNGKYELEFELEWREGDSKTGEITVE